jgi:TetR/AcrR family transcriptional repressor of nem operon
MKKGERTRQEIVKRAAPLFNRQGYYGTAISDLMRETKLQKGGIYRHFHSKEELARAAFDYAWQIASTNRLQSLDRVSNRADRLKQFVANFVERRSDCVPGGCPLLNTAIEVDDGHPALRTRARRALGEWLKWIETVVTEGVARREINRQVNPQEVAGLLVATLEGALMISRLTGNDRALRVAQNHLDAYLEAEVGIPGA